MTGKISVLCISLLAFLATTTFATPALQIGHQCAGSVIRVFDADTLLFRCNTGKTALVRLAGIDAPESTKTTKLCWQQPFGDAATTYARQRFLYKKFTLKITDLDKYNRWVGLLFDNKNHTANAWLIEQGLAHVYRHYDHPVFWETLEQQAQKQNKGLWHNPKACIIDPHIWRHTSENKRCAQEIIFKQMRCQF